MIALKLIFPLDYVVLLISVLFILFSAWKGFIQSILGLMTWIGSILITLYSYTTFSNFIYNQLYKIDIFQKYELISDFLSIIIAIPVIFLLSLFILKRIKKILSSDLDKQILGIIIDKIFGIIYGIVFSYIIFASITFFIDKINLHSLNFWLSNNSIIINNIIEVNEKYLYKFIYLNELEEL